MEKLPNIEFAPKLSDPLYRVVSSELLVLVSKTDKSYSGLSHLPEHFSRVVTPFSGHQNRLAPTLYNRGQLDPPAPCSSALATSAIFAVSNVAH